MAPPHPHANAFLDLALHTPEPLTHEQVALLRKLDRDFIRIRAVLPEAQDNLDLADPPRTELSPAEMFRQFYRQYEGLEADPSLIELFVELATLATDRS